MRTTITVTAIDWHWMDGHLTFTDHEVLASGPTLAIEQDRVSVGVGDPGIVLTLTPPDHERAYDHPWIDNKGRVWTSYTVDVDIQP